MDRIKEIYQHNGTDWGDAIPIGVDAKYVDVTDESSSIPLNNLIKDMTQEELQEFLGNLPSGIPADYVKKSGDTMTGNLYFSGANNQSVGFIVNKNGENLDCGWDFDKGGAGIGLRSPNYGDSSMQGSFVLYARSQADEAYTKYLVGRPNGTLTWDGYPVLHTGLAPTVYDYSAFTYSSGFTAYSTTGQNAPTAYKYGRLVTLVGAFKTTAAQTSTGVKTMGYVPSACKPIRDFRCVSQGSAQYRFLLEISASGVISASRYGVATDINIPNDAWLNIYCTYMSAT